MTFTRKDLGATVLTALVLLTFAAAHESWNVPLVGDSRRWAAGTILLLGMLACGLGSPGTDRSTKVSMVLGTLALVLSVTSILTGSPTLLSLLVVDVVALWIVATLRHAAWPAPPTAQAGR